METVQLAVLNPHGRRYTEAEKEAAYFLWRTAAGRSCREVARRLGISVRQVSQWSSDFTWVERANQEDHEDVASIRHAVGAVVTYELVPSIETAKEIRDNKSLDPKVRLDAAKWLAGLGGVSPVSKIETAVTDRTERIIEAQPDFSTMSDQELRDYEESVKARRTLRNIVSARTTG